MAALDYRNIDPVTAYPRAIDAMMNLGFILSPRYKEQQGRANRVGAHPRILEFSDKMVRRCALLGIPVFPHCIVRSPDAQAARYALGHSAARPDRPFPHAGFAVDIIHSCYGWLDNVIIPHAWDVIGHLGHEVARSMDLKIVWGGDWDGDGDTMDNRLFDPAHWELEGWRDMELPA